jgi:hypothetical protein
VSGRWAKNGIGIVEVAREHRICDDQPILKTSVHATRIRFRPILMTSFAFILGVLPLVLATGAGANARKSLGISVFTGMIASTCLAVVFVPAFFVVLQRLDERKRRKPSVAPGRRGTGGASGRSLTECGHGLDRFLLCSAQSCSRRCAGSLARIQRFGCTELMITTMIAGTRISLEPHSVRRFGYYGATATSGSRRIT